MFLLYTSVFMDVLMPRSLSSLWPLQSFNYSQIYFSMYFFSYLADPVSVIALLSFINMKMYYVPGTLIIHREVKISNVPDLAKCPVN